MNCYVKYIGVVDQNDKTHAVPFGPGVNVITGKSSTGKSAMIEIFDYCFGSSEFTVPEGVITEYAQFYFVVLSISGTNLVLARTGKPTKAFLREERHFSINLIKSSYFDNNDFEPVDDFKKRLGCYFGLTITDVDTDEEQKKIRGRKSSTPSVRSFSSFMLQHQNLVANKHAIFYRFDQKEKREQAIDHFKIFAGYVDQEYFLIWQKINDLNRQLKRIEIQIPRKTEDKRRVTEQIELALREYASVSGTHLVTETASVLITSPSHWLSRIKDMPIVISAESDEHVKQMAQFKGERDLLIGKMRELQHKKSAVSASIRFAKEYAIDAQAVTTPTNTEIRVSECPFCHTMHNEVEREANQLTDAIEWLNEELRRSPYFRESFEADEKQLADQINELQKQVNSFNDKIGVINKQVSELQKYRSLEMQVMKAKLRVEATLENYLDYKNSDLEEQHKSILEEIRNLNKKLKDNYDVDTHIRAAETFIQNEMEKIGSHFEFEKTYRPIKLKFSFTTFDLWHEQINKKIFLRSMGSGANWLYCHVTLFLALHKYFCSLKDKCKIPSILFLDQPSQVYFPPSVQDVQVKFDAKRIAEQTGKLNEVDEDIHAVENLYSQLVDFCTETLAETGIMPQIIVTDHADNLKLAGSVDFEALVGERRWRTRGFIDAVGL